MGVALAGQAVAGISLNIGESRIGYLSLSVSNCRINPSLDVELWLLNILITPASPLAPFAFFGFFLSCPAIFAFAY